VNAIAKLWRWRSGEILLAELSIDVMNEMVRCEYSLSSLFRVILHEVL